jgi:hypothetical protein
LDLKSLFFEIERRLRLRLSSPAAVSPAIRRERRAICDSPHTKGEAQQLARLSSFVKKSKALHLFA